MEKTERGGGTVGKALKVLDEIAAAGGAVRFVDLLSKSEYPKPTLYRLLQTLTQQNMLRYDPERQLYSLGLRLVRLAHAAWQQASLAPIARPYIDALSAKIGETVHLAQLDNGQVLYIDKRNASAPIEMFSQAGKIGPSYCTGIGKAMLAFLPPEQQAHAISQQAFHRYTAQTLTNAAALMADLKDIRKSGVAFDREEHEPQIICIAVPIFAAQGQVIGGLSVTSSTQRSTLTALAALKPALLAAAKHIGDEAENWHFPALSAPC